jgi:hypothetical protein
MILGVIFVSNAVILTWQTTLNDVRLSVEGRCARSHQRGKSFRETCWHEIGAVSSGSRLRAGDA